MQDIIRKLCNGDEVAFKAFFYQHKDAVYKYAFLHLRDQDIAADVVQDVFVKFWNKRNEIDPKKNVRAYLYTICRNVVLEEFRKNLQSQTYTSYLLSKPEEIQNTCEEKLLVKELEGLLDDAIRLLPLQRQRIYRMSKLENLSHDEIAETLQISKNTVRDQLVKGSRFVREYILIKRNAIALCMLFIIFL